MAVNKILVSVVAGHVPSGLVHGQVAINENDGIIFWLDGTDNTTIRSFNFRNPTVPDQIATNNSTKAANTSFVQTLIAALIGAAPSNLNTLELLADAVGNDPNFITTVNAALTNRIRFDAAQSLNGTQLAQVKANIGLTTFAPLASPTFTGVPFAPTAALGDSSSQIATDAFVAGTFANAIQYVTSQTITDAQQVNVRKTISASPFDAMAYHGMQVNGGMEVSQFLGAPLNGTTTPGYVLDGVNVSWGGSGGILLNSYQYADAPPGYNYSLAINIVTSKPSISAGDYVVAQFIIEGNRVARLRWGTVNASSIAVGFWIKAHQTGLFSFDIANIAGTRSYVVPFTITAADTWQYITAVIPGDTSGTWPTGNVGSFNLRICLACGVTFQTSSGSWQNGNFVGVTGTTNGVSATANYFEIAGVMLLPGNELPQADRAFMTVRQFDAELDLCMRYWEKSYSYLVVPGTSGALRGLSMVWCNITASKGGLGASVNFQKRKRIDTPSMIFYDLSSGFSGCWTDLTAGLPGIPQSGPALTSVGENGFTWVGIISPSNPGFFQGAAHWTADARI